MKRFYLTLALVLCLILCAFAFASCGKKKTATATTGKNGTTECAHTWSDYVVDVEPTCYSLGVKSKYCTKCGAQDPASLLEIDMIDHVPSADFTVDTKPTCIANGYQSKHCSICGQPVASTVEEIPIDNKAHNVEEWLTIEPTLLAPNGNRTGTCTLCHTEVEEDLVWTPYVFSSTMTSEERAAFNREYGVDWLNHKDGNNGIYIKKSVNDIKGKEEHYYPDESNGNLGNDLLVEVSYLWNSTMTSGGGYTGEPLTFADADGYDVFHVGSKIDMKIRAGYEYGFINPADPASPAATPSIGEYGWHRLGFRIHQDAEIVGTTEKSVKYTYVATAYLDGAEVLKFDLTDWVTKYFKSTVTGLLYIAYIDENEELAYADIGAGSHSSYINSHALFIVENFFGSVNATAYVVLGDMQMTCGHDFVQDVEANANPVDATFTLDDKGTTDTADDVTCPAKIWYKAVVE